MGIIVRLVINAIALYAAAYLIDGISWEGGNFGSLFIVAIVFGLINALIKPLLKLFSLPLLILTLGLFTLVINALMLMLTSALTKSFSVDGFASAFMGGVIISIVSALLSRLIPDGKDRE